MTIKAIRKISIAAAAAIAALVLTTAGAAAPQITESSESEEPAEPDRVIEKLEENWFPTDVINATASTEANVLAVPSTIPPDERPEAGEIIEVRYADATVVHHAVTAACTVSAGAGTPYKSGSNVLANTSFSQTGCAIDKASSALEMWWGLGWDTRDSANWTNVQSGAGYSAQLLASCPNTNTSTFRSWVANGYVNEVGQSIVSMSSEAALPCGI